MSLSRPRLTLLLASAAATAVLTLASVRLLEAQVFVCYAEWCIPKGTGQTCIVKMIPCPTGE